MKTKQQKMKEVEEYLIKTSNHIFMDQNSEILAVRKTSGGWKFLRGEKVFSLDIEKDSAYTSDLKQWYKYRLFGDKNSQKKYHSVKGYKALKEEVTSRFN